MPVEVPALPDLSVCETEPICFPGTVQPRGALLVVDPASGRLTGASLTSEALLGRPADRLLGQPLALAIGPEAATRLLAADTAASDELVDLSLPGQPLVARASRNTQGQVLVDIEPGQPHATDLQQGYRRLARALRQVADEPALAQAAAAGIRSLTGHDRVMVYRFDADWNGEVLGEACASGLEPFLGLHYPASDIPRQARELFALARVRVIADIDDTPSALLAQTDARSIDLGLSALRSVSPVHIEYCRNMGVRATLVGSLVVGGRLWGLVSCHHSSGPKPVPPAERDALGNLCDDLAAQIGLAQLQRRQARQHELAMRRAQLIDSVRRVDLRALLRQPAAQDVLDVMSADGFAMVSGTAVHRVGHTPSEAAIRALIAHPRVQQAGPLRFASHALAADVGTGTTDDGVAGAVVVAVDTVPQTLLLWFRDERSRAVRWAGDPAHPHHTHADGRISPRQSFAAFLKLVEGQSLPWSTDELASATDLASLIDIEALREREAFNQTILDSSPDHLCVLDPQGVIVTVNRAWVRFAQANGANAATCLAVGMDYRQICQLAVGQTDGAEASAAWNGIAAVLDGRQTHFSLDYPCDSPNARRWFQMLVYPMRPPCEGVVVLHQDVTARKLAELALQISEQQARAVLQDQTELICRFKIDGCILYVNPAFCRFFGQAADSLTGQRWQPVVWPEDLPEVEAALAKLSPQQPLETIENRVIAGDGRLRWVQFVNRGFFDGDGRLVELQAVGRDITERKAIESELARHRDQLEQLVVARTQALASAKSAAEEALAELRQAHGAITLGMSTRRAAMQSMSDAVLVTDAEGRFVDFNDAFALFHRFPDKASFPATLEAFLPLLDVYLPDGAPAPLSQWPVPCALRGETAAGAEFTLRRSDTGESWLGSVSYAPIRDDDGRILGAVLTARDITSMRRATVELQQAKEAAEAANRAKTSLLATMSHELRTPMNAIMGMADLALRRATDPKQIDQLGKAQKASRHLLAIIADVLDIARIESDRLELARAPFQLDGLLENLAAQMRVMRGDRDLTCSMEIDPKLKGLRVYGDATRLLQVLLNLTSNAVKFTQHGTVRVLGGLLHDSPHRVTLRFEVQDTGIGISPTDQAHVFRPFWQADGSTTRPYGGTGLGLAVSRQLVTLMGGEIGLHSTPGTGSRFWFTVELDRAEAPDTAADAASPEPDAEALRAALRARHAGARVLVAEDDAMNREVTVTLLQECGLHTEAAVDGHEAVAIAGRQRFDLVLMDVQMPGMNGLDATRLIRQQSVAHRVPVVALTANVFAEDRMRSEAAGMDAFIGRPCEPAELLATALHWLDVGKQ